MTMTYKPPRAKMKDRLIFCIVASCIFLMIPSGRIASIRSRMQLGISSASRYACLSMQCPGRSGCHAFWTGVHRNVNANVDAKYHRVQAISTAVLAIRKPSSTRNILRYSKSKLSFAAVMVYNANRLEI